MVSLKKTFSVAMVTVEDNTHPWFSPRVPDNPVFNTRRFVHSPANNWDYVIDLKIQ